MGNWWGCAKLLFEKMEYCDRKFHGLVRPDNIQFTPSSNGIAAVTYLIWLWPSLEKIKQKSQNRGKVPQMYQYLEFNVRLTLHYNHVEWL